MQLSMEGGDLKERRSEVEFKLKNKPGHTKLRSSFLSLPTFQSLLSYLDQNKKVQKAPKRNEETTRDEV